MQSNDLFLVAALVEVIPFSIKEGIQIGNNDVDTCFAEANGVNAIINDSKATNACSWAATLESVINLLNKEGSLQYIDILLSLMEGLEDNICFSSW